MVMEESKDIKMTYTNFQGQTFEIEPIKRMVTKHTRAGYSGKTIICPKCDTRTKVFHFSWSALGCQHCSSMVDKYEWKLL